MPESEYFIVHDTPHPNPSSIIHTTTNPIDAHQRRDELRREHGPLLPIRVVRGP